jgi:hypothetical protein
MRLIYYSLFILICCSFSCSARKGEVTNSEIEPVKLSINTSRQFQTIENFGASDAWACQFAGLWPDEKKNAIADLLFSTDTFNDGSPKGIGLSLWRFGIGAGSAQQGEASGIKDEWRRAESFLEPNGTYNWNRQAGEVWFLKAAQQRGVKQFLGFLNSPPVNFTKNQKAYASNGITNIDSTKLKDLGNYIVEVIKGVKNSTAVELNYISPVNEPQWDWSDGGQEGSPYRNEDIFALVKALNNKLQQSNLPAKIIVTEAGHIKYLLADEDKPGKGNQANVFFNPSSPYYLGQFPSVNKTIAAHSYFSTSPSSTAISMRQNIATRVASLPGINYWQSEYCILGDNDGEIKGEKRDLGMTSALYVANVIHKDLVFANATAWQWWLAVSPYDYKDGLVFIDQNKSNGTVYPSKTLWALGNYSRFIRPGMTRVELSMSENTTGVTASAYIDQPSKKMVLVFVNTSWDIQKISVANTTNSTAVALTKFDMYTTSEQKNMQRQSVSSETLSLEPKSITTLVTDY